MVGSFLPRLRWTEDSEDSDRPFDESESLPWDEDALPSVTLQPSASWDPTVGDDEAFLAPLHALVDVHLCHSETCDACRRPQPPQFIPVSDCRLVLRGLSGTRWWENDRYDPSLMESILDLLDTACSTPSSNGGLTVVSNEERTFWAPDSLWSNVVSAFLPDGR